MATPSLIKPPALQRGDTVAVISLSWGGASVLPGRFEQGKRQLAETFGFTVIETPNATRDPAWLRDNPHARAQDLHWALENPDVAGIITVIGGNESIRTVPFLDLDLIAAHPKVFTGFSDTTVQHLVHRKAGVGSFYGMSVLVNAAEAGGIHPYTISEFRRAAMSADRIGELAPATEWTEEYLDWNDTANLSRPRRWVPNYGWLWIQTAEEPVEGPIIGGCMEVLAMAVGTDIWPEAEAFDNAVLHLEISEEKPPIGQVTNWLRNYAALGILERISALLFSRPLEYSLRDTLALYEQIKAELLLAGRADLPFVANLDYGHSSPMGLLPLGRRARVDCGRRSIAVTESAVS
ncbi:MAG TPA: S66 peptidase family protein [Jatrophihabitans sp.]|jgi:muramoyltetrapeptide carboxypeptidase LdcA involved in peptidoglycan recycling